ncbi:MAG TPA: pentapeptide repeat-containing protein, partial [Planctomycetota bacterium]|nr:pentapeptide repeat-containing protein [Planctomycetota bacterium]
MFHLGSSRSGLVFGEPSEGTRNGFYTDDFNDQSYRSPEEIRVANLRGADLRGAVLRDTDFYLVDLREAKYTPEQGAYLRRCGAILETRV